MPLIAKGRGADHNNPPEGPQQAVCVDVVDLGMVDRDFNGKKKTQHRIVIVWHSAEIDPETGAPFIIESFYTLSLDERARLTADLQAWRGRAFTAAELLGFDVESVIGANCFLAITYKVTPKRTYANVSSIMKLPRGMTPLPITEGYVRRCDRDDGEPPEHGDDAGIPNDDEIPF